MDTRVLLLTDFQEAASTLQCEVAAIMAVAKVESDGEGFCADGFPKTLFEGQHFYRYTHGLYAQQHPTICYEKQTYEFYGKACFPKERQRLADAIRLDRNAALMSASWGKFQIMGFNYAICGCTTIQQFVNRMCKSEHEHLDLFCEYIIHAGMSDELQAKDWPRLARLYNGPLYWKNHYDIILAEAYEASVLELEG
jgi:hypothetical protein